MKFIHQWQREAKGIQGFRTNFEREAFIVGMGATVNVISEEDFIARVEEAGKAGLDPRYAGLISAKDLAEKGIVGASGDVGQQQARDGDP